MRELLTTKEAAQVLFCDDQKSEPTRRDLARIYDMVEHGDLTPVYKTVKKHQFFIKSKEIKNIID
jgi:hypothetical protein|tara:strand:- start:1586 stop:1780 length:195 start_codon:yes stop_codon:yes gene_type:complete